MFETHKVNENGFEQIKDFKSRLNQSVTSVLKIIPDGREKSLFLTKIEEAVFFATKAIASKEGNFSEIITYRPPSTKTAKPTKNAKR